ncbi:3'-5' exonuclease, putative [Plasmodium chabaudi adami]|uniref:3'-5' exonuclease, putative n=2 Tax=Plasmodium chabaudi adami TaxID=5826 RepID=A0A1D3LEZ5_PLACE|nr:3'-5' exonuclease, putative [Plasmodium chabaudi adami]
MYRYLEKCASCITLKRRISSASYGYLNLSVNDKVVRYFEDLKKNIIYINDSKECKKYINEIEKNAMNENLKIIGLDIEGYKIGRNGTVSIIQVCAKDIYIFDLYKCDNSYLFVKYLKELFENKNIIKVAHDCREDCSILFNQYNINLNNIFDTQIAYNLILKKSKKELYQISYDDLLYKCLFLNNNHKIYFHKIISLDNKIYLKRPISKELIHYAVQDVLYLKPLMLNLVGTLRNIENVPREDNESDENGTNENYDQSGKHSKLNLDLCKDTQQIVEENNNFHLINYVIEKSQKYIDYQYLNSHIKNEKHLQKGMIIEGMIVSCNNTNLYVKLNLSKRGVIKKFMDNTYEIGDIVKCVILDFCENDFIKLGLLDSSTSEMATIPK